MLGLIFCKLKDFVETSFSEAVWQELLSECNIKRPAYHDTIVYPDEELFCLIGKAVKKSGIPLPDLLEKFGKFIAPSLIEQGKQWKLIRNTWKTFEVTENLFSIHKGVLMFSSQATNPPDIQAKRISDTEIEVCYSSSKNIPELAVGVLKGIGKYYNENLEVNIISREGCETKIQVLKKY